MEAETRKKTIRYRTKGVSYKVDVGEDFNGFNESPTGVSWMMYDNSELTQGRFSRRCDLAVEVLTQYNRHHRLSHIYNDYSEAYDTKCESHPILIVRGTSARRHIDNQLYRHPTSSMKIMGDVALSVPTNSSVIYTEELAVASTKLVSTLPQEIISEIDKAVSFNAILNLPISDEVLKQKIESYVEPLIVLEPQSLSLELTASFSVNIHMTLTENTTLFLKKPLNDVPEMAENDFIFSLLFEREEVITAVAPLDEILEGTRRFIAA